MGRQAHSALCLSALKGEKRRNNGASCKDCIFTFIIIANVIRLVKMFFEKNIQYIEKNFVSNHKMCKMSHDLRQK